MSGNRWWKPQVAMILMIYKGFIGISYSWLISDISGHCCLHGGLNGKTIKTNGGFSPDFRRANVDIFSTNAVNNPQERRKRLLNLGPEDVNGMVIIIGFPMVYHRNKGNTWARAPGSKSGSENAMFAPVFYETRALLYPECHGFSNHVCSWWKIINPKFDFCIGMRFGMKHRDDHLIYPQSILSVENNHLWPVKKNTVSAYLSDTPLSASLRNLRVALSYTLDTVSPFVVGEKPTFAESKLLLVDNFRKMKEQKITITLIF